MSEPTTPPPAICPWCSAELPDPTVANCPSCHAHLAAAPDSQVPGVTAVDVQALALRRTSPPKKNRLLSWISGDADYEDVTEPIPPPGSLDLPGPEVRREMLRLEMAAKIADLTAEAGAMAADEAIAAGATGDLAAARADILAEVDATAASEAMVGEDLAPLADGDVATSADDATTAHEGMTADPDGSTESGPDSPA
jgi:hypothetical protein